MSKNDRQKRIKNGEQLLASDWPYFGGSWNILNFHLLKVKISSQLFTFGFIKTTKPSKFKNLDLITSNIILLSLKSFDLKFNYLQKNGLEKYLYPSPCTVLRAEHCWTGGSWRTSNRARVKKWKPGWFDFYLCLQLISHFIFNFYEI